MKRAGAKDLRRVDVIEIYSDSDTTDGETDPSDRAARQAQKRRKVLDDRSDSNGPPQSFCLSSGISTNSIPVLPPSENVGTLSLKQLLTPDLVETWQINFSIDLDFLLSSIHTQNHPVVHIVTAGDAIDVQVLLANSDKVHVHKVQLEDQWGTHHSKIMVNFFQDESCEIVIHTANLLRIDWEEKSESIWRSPRLLRAGLRGTGSDATVGNKFKEDLIAYFNAYQLMSLQPLIERLKQFDFTKIRAIFIASVPGVYSESSTDFGLAKLRQVLSKSHFLAKGSDQTIVQVSSIGNLGKPFYEAFQMVMNTVPSPWQKTLGENHFRLIFPTIKNVKESISGWISGFSLFFNVSTSAGQRQLAWSQPHLRQWAAMEAGRECCMPHVKSYSRIDRDGKEIKWILFTSSNLSKAAWGGRESGKIKIKSYEAGILLTSDLFDGKPLRPSYKRNDQHPDAINVRMPYDLQLSKYHHDDQIWSLQHEHPCKDVDWLGNTRHGLMQ